jgi:hypothetical protein
MAKAPNPNQGGLDFGNIEEINLKENADKARQKAKDFYTSDPEYAKKLEQREEAKKQDERMREIVKEKAEKKATAQSSMISPKGNTTAAGRGELSSRGGGGGAGMPKSSRDLTKNYKKGGSVSSRADGCAQRGKTKGRMI